jgi:hypothetical protein
MDEQLIKIDPHERFIRMLVGDKRSMMTKQPSSNKTSMYAENFAQD